MIQEPDTIRDKMCRQLDALDYRVVALEEDMKTAKLVGTDNANTIEKQSRVLAALLLFAIVTTIFAVITAIKI